MFPANAFIDPHGKNKTQVQRQAQALLLAFLEHLTSAAQQTPLPSAPLTLGDVLPTDAVAWNDVLPKLQQLWQGAANPAQPGFLAHMDSVPTTWAWLGELVTAGLNNNLLSAELSPLFTQLEQQLLRRMAALFGLPPTANGNLSSGGSLANLQALAVARTRQLGTAEVWRLGQQPVMFASAAAHVSLQKAAVVLGLGENAVQAVPTDAEGRLDCQALQAQILTAQAAGQLPFCLVATAGTTTTGSIDPIAEMAALARRHNLWLHVDAAYGGALAFSPSRQHLLAGIAQADSLTFNPQKWLYVPKACAMVLFARASDWQAVFPDALPYMQTGAQPNLGTFSLQGTRSAEVLKLWLALQQLGQVGVAALIEQAYQQTAYLSALLRQRPFIRLAHTPQTNIICWRAEPTWLPASEWDAWNARLQAYLLRTHRIFLSLPRYQGLLWLRTVLLNPHTDRALLQRLVAAVDAFALAD